MEVKLVVVGGRHAGKEIPVTGPQFLIGRGERCQLRPQSDLVSREHCAIIIEEGSVLVRDLNSRNGTFVNDQRVEGSRKLHSGDRLKVGPLEFEVRLDVPIGGKKKPKVQSIQEAAARAAKDSGGPEEEDISDWLGREDDSEEPVGGETAVGGGSTTTVAPSQQPKPTPKIDPALAVKYFGGKEEDKPKASSSREAAAEMLKKFFHQTK